MSSWVSGGAPTAAVYLWNHAGGSENSA